MVAIKSKSDGTKAPRCLMFVSNQRIFRPTLNRCSSKWFNWNVISYGRKDIQSIDSQLIIFAKQPRSPSIFAISRGGFAAAKSIGASGESTLISTRSSPFPRPKSRRTFTFPTRVSVIYALNFESRRAPSMKSTRCLDRSLDRAANKLRENVLSARRAAPAGASLVELLRETIDRLFFLRQFWNFQRQPSRSREDVGFNNDSWNWWNWHSWPLSGRLTAYSYVAFGSLV